VCAKIFRSPHGKTSEKVRRFCIFKESNIFPESIRGKSISSIGDVVDANTRSNVKNYVGVLISLWLFPFPIFLFAAQPKEFFLVGLKKLEQRNHKCVELGGNM
jgi:hypothetical protein